MANRIRHRKKLSGILYSVIGFILLLMILVGIQKYFKSNYRVPEESVWIKIRQEAALYDLESSFVYSIIYAESSLRPRARNTGGNGIM